jgi:DNA-binding transcriptional MerR regulator|tara:strand:+ start:230 stop:418 length:189 start_codon:yes stop_codon:yes gene_type:complete
MIYSIGEVAKLLRVSTASLRSWEKQGFIPEPTRRPTMQREYSDEDIIVIDKFLSQHIEAKKK